MIHRCCPCDWCPETVTFVELDLIFSPVPSDTPNPFQSHGWLEDVAVFKRSDRAPANIALHTIKD